eukprot:XP_001702059.1 predicted protein [Chlamydomonas reinhardtii]
MTEDDDASRGCDDVGRQLDGVAGPHRQGLLLAYASGCTAEEFEAVYDEYLQYEWGRGNGGLALGELCSALLQRAASSLRPDGSWALKVDLVLARLRERMGGVDAAAASAEHWLHMFEEACGSGVSDTAILAQLLSWAGLSGPVQPAAAGAAAAGAAADEEEDDCRVLTVTRVVNSMLAAGSETAVLWAARRLRELGCHPGPPLTLLQLWAAALGGNFAAVRAACAAGLGRMPDWLPDCAYQVSAVE